MQRLLVDAQELAPMLSLSVRTIRELQDRGLPQVRVGRRVLFEVADQRRAGRPRRIVL